jgi:signal transduction histidine kinase
MVSAAENLPDLISIADFQQMVAGSNDRIQSFHIEGIVRAVVPQRKLIALQDRSAAVLIELPTFDDSIHAGDRVSVEGENCSLRQSRFYTQLGTAPVVDNDGRHEPRLRSGRVFLEAGRQPIHLEWFNSLGGSMLEVEWQGPGVQRQRIPGTVLWRQPLGVSNRSELEHGLDSAAYNGNDLYSLSDFQMNANPVAQGIATNFNLSYRARAENTVLAFNGFIEVSRAGIYTFYVTSDDGAILRVGEPKISCKVLAPPDQSVSSENLDRLSGDFGDQWGSLEGEVGFASKDQQNLEIGLVGKMGRVPVAVLEGLDLFSTNLMRRQIRVSGIYQYFRSPEEKKLVGIIVPSSKQVDIIGSLNEGERKFTTHDFLTTVARVRQLKPDEVALGIPVKIQGVVIGAWPTDNQNNNKLVLCDSTGGLSVHFDIPKEWVDQPQIGELLDIEGFTIPGQFVPAIQARKITRLGNAPMPEPIRPTWDEVMNGSLDCEYVEIQGVLTAASTNEMTLLTRDGKVTLDRTDVRPLPQMPTSGGSLVGSVVRLRGGFNSEWDSTSRQVIRGRFHLIHALMSVEYPNPQDPFSSPTIKIGDLLWYNAHASALQRVKVHGQVIFAQPGECFALDHNVGFRILTAEPKALQAGDLIEAVGFPNVGGSSPFLQEGIIRKLGQAPLPEPIKLSGEEMHSLLHDSALIQVEARLINYTIRPDGQILELHAGQTPFEARLKLGSRQPLPLTIGSQLRLTGVYAVLGAGQIGARTDPFELLLNRPEDVSVIELPPWWTVRRALGVAAVLSGALGLAVAWAALLRRKVEMRTTQLKMEIEGRQQVERQRLMEQERTRMAQDLHDELGAGLTEMSLLGSLAKRPDIPAEEKERYLDQLTRSAHSLVAGLDEIVWAINPHYDPIGSIATYFSFYAEEFLNLANITCRLQMAESFPKVSLDSQVRHDIFLAFKEALNNVVRHSGASAVTLKINMVEQQLAISIADNGCGFECGSAHPGSDGISGMRTRLQKLGGACNISSQPGHGTTIEFCLNIAATPLAPSHDVCAIETHRS